MRVLDGNGVTMQGFADPLDMARPLRHAWAFDPNAWKGGDRMSASVVNVRHPDIFRCLVGCHDDQGREMKDLPALVLRPSAEVHSRVSCMSWFDGGSLNHNCRPLDPTGGCIGGCPNGRVADADTALHAMLEAQDAHVVPWGSCASQRNDCDYHITAERYWNEVVLDKYLQPWNADITSMVDAVAIAPNASAASMEYAVAVHRSLAWIFEHHHEPTPPLVYYDAQSMDSLPFKIVEGNDI